MLNANVSRTEFMLNGRSLLVWTLIIIAVIGVYLGSYTFMEELDLVEMIEGYPEILTTGLGMSPEMFGEVNLYHGGLVMLYALLLASIYAMMLAGTMITRDSDLGTVEFLYTRPLTRTAIMFSKALSFLVMMVLLWAAAYLASAALGRLFIAPDRFDLEAQLLVHVMGLLACLAAGGIAFFLSPLINRVQGSTSLAVGLGFAFFILNSLGAFYEQLDFLRYLSIHYYANLSGAAGGETFAVGIIVLISVFGAGVVGGVILLNRKEFTA